MNDRIEVTVDAVRVPLARRRIAEIARAVLRAEHASAMRLSITFVSTEHIAAMNARHLGHAGATDVISFSLTPDGCNATPTGDIYIAPDVARRNAAEHGSTIREEIARLVVHGVLHVLGHDHPNGTRRLASRMWRRQEALVESLAPLHSPRRRRSTGTAA
jgi:probable rRNA maturation factor